MQLMRVGKANSGAMQSGKVKEREMMWSSMPDAVGKSLVGALVPIYVRDRRLSRARQQQGSRTFRASGTASAVPALV